ncbi:hypothetical protein ONZ51_g10326 [Trametes cubensis]|uniref:Uncharacterized protein n=1 Tax=Trametes cubensis TaxID=1111947 RepID=A0AAD7TKA1_9APHY|nr:hypothetical protein ONZ51_g10326 [Trametes cubensis]
MHLKRRRTDAIDPAELTPFLSASGLSRLKELDKDDAARVLAQLQVLTDVSDREIKKARATLPSFSAATWQDLAGQYGLPTKYNARKLHQHRVPMCYLPPSFHTELFVSSWRAADVYMDKIYQKREAARVRVLEPYILPLIALFHGRVVDKPEDPMPDTEETSGGEVEHEVFAIGDALFFVIEVKLLAPQEERNAAQLFMELLSAARSNQDTRQKVRVYGLLTDLSRFAFFSYDPVGQRFAFDEEFVADGPREQFLTRMIPVTNKIFSVLLAGYIEVLQTNPEDESANGDGDPRLALQLANEAKVCLTESASDFDALETRGREGLRKLEQSVLAVPRGTDAYMDVQEPKSAEELASLASRLVREWHEKRARPPSVPGS